MLTAVGIAAPAGVLLLLLWQTLDALLLLFGGLLFGLFLAILLVVVLFGLFVAAQPATLLDGVVRLVATARREHGALVEAGDAVRKWLLATVLRVAFIGVATSLCADGSASRSPSCSRSSPPR